MVNRRHFLKQFGISLTAACALAVVPEAVIKALSTVDAGRRCACDYLRAQFYAFVGGDGANLPLAMRVSPGLYAAFEREMLINTRFMVAVLRHGVSVTTFKNTPIVASPDLSGWTVEFTRDQATADAWHWDYVHFLAAQDAA